MPYVVGLETIRINHLTPELYNNPKNLEIEDISVKIELEDEWATFDYKIEEMVKFLEGGQLNHGGRYSRVFRHDMSSDFIIDFIKEYLNVSSDEIEFYGFLGISWR